MGRLAAHEQATLVARDAQPEASGLADAGPDDKALAETASLAEQEAAACPSVLARAHPPRVA